MIDKLIVVFNNLYKNKGIQNLSMKALVKGSFFLFNLYIINNLPIAEVARFALFYTTARFFSFFGTDSMHITRFAEIREIHLGLIEDSEIIDNIKTHFFISHALLFILSLLIFQETLTVISVNLVAVALSAIRLLADYSKVNNKIWKSIIIEDLIFTIGFIFLSVVFIQFFEDVIVSITLAISICAVFSITYALYYFKKKLYVDFLKFGKFNFDLKRFWFSNKFTLLKGVTVFVLYLSRQFGDFYYGEQMVAETHLMLIFINVFMLISTSIVAGFQNEIVLKKDEAVTTKLFIKVYKKLTFPIIYFVLLICGLLIVFAEEFLLIITPNFSYLKSQFIYTILLVLLYFIVNPIFYFFYMNKRVSNFNSFIALGYITLMAVVASGYIIENYWIWFFSLISVLVLIPIQVAISGIINLKKP